MIFLNFIVGSFVTFVVVACYLVTASFTIWMMIDAGKQDRFWWLTLIIGIPVIGAAVYYFSEKKHEYIKVSPHRLHTSETEEQHEKAPKKKRDRKAKKSEKKAEQIIESVTGQVVTTEEVRPVAEAAE